MSSPYNDPKTKWRWNYQMHAEITFNSRNNFFLVAESMLILSYATLISRSCLAFIKGVIVFLGIIFTTAWLYVNLRSYVNMGKLMDKNKEIPEYKEIAGEHKLIPANMVVGCWLPFLTLTAWMCLLALMMAPVGVTIVWIIVLSLCIILYKYCKTDKKPKEKSKK